MISRTKSSRNFFPNNKIPKHSFSICPTPPGYPELRSRCPYQCFGTLIQRGLNLFRENVIREIMEAPFLLLKSKHQASFCKLGFFTLTSLFSQAPLRGDVSHTDGWLLSWMHKLQSSLELVAITKIGISLGVHGGMMWYPTLVLFNSVIGI